MCSLCVLNEKWALCIKREQSPFYHNGDQQYLKVLVFIISFLKSLVIHVIWLTFQSDLCTNHTIFGLNHICCKSLHSLYKLCHFRLIPPFLLCYIISVLSRKFDLQAFLLPLLNNHLLDQMNIATDLVLRFPNGCIKVVIELGIISDQIALPSVQLPLLTSHLFNGLDTGSM